MSRTIASRLFELGYELPEVTPAAGSYRPYVRLGETVYFAGQVSKKGQDAAFVGKVGRDWSLEQAREAAILSCLSLLAQINEAAAGNMDAVKQVCRLGGFVNSTKEFTAHSKVIDAASDLMEQVFGSRGVHCRTAVGAPSLPRGVAVEIDAIVEISEMNTWAPPVQITS